jgi:hypothetical protein
MTENEQIGELREHISELEQECRSYCKERKCTQCELFFTRMDCQNHFIAKGLTAKGYRKVRHGTWRFGRQNGEPYAECTACGRKMAINCYGYAYCCLCGARMDGGTTNDGE